ncbi:MAG: RnfABCDGE type electron transport complex subunit G [Desulfobacterales bacterium]|jgi:Na+-translocating ferredoxin:NAD+ oxidoreductase subunit G|nr:RnfABCDGE type electron transport complex subunit G [Desulfobacteraceae bacterium]MBT7696806.1 RnfABCDGE type electron transport complex subunit G [Desulfobacterales bacterium]
MTELIKMVVVLVLLSSSSGGLLHWLKTQTSSRIEDQQVKFVKGPALKSIFEGSSNDPTADRFTLKVGETEKNFFVGKFDGKTNCVAFEGFGKGGYGGDIGLMIGVDIDNGSVLGAAVTTHSETPGLGAKAKEDPSFVSQLKGLSIESPILVTNDGGKINAMSGATITSRAVCNAANDAGKIYKEIKSQLTEKVKSF